MAATVAFVAEDTLSRIEAVDTCSSGTNLDALATAQTDDDGLSEPLCAEQGKHPLQLKRTPLPFSPSDIVCDVAGDTPRAYLPTTFRFNV